jgi:hypothetical protein
MYNLGSVHVTNESWRVKKNKTTAIVRLTIQGSARTFSLESVSIIGSWKAWVLAIGIMADTAKKLCTWYHEFKVYNFMGKQQ